MTRNDVIEAILGFLLLAAFLVGLPWLAVIWETVGNDTPDRGVAQRVSDCGEEYRREYEAVLKRIGTMNGYCIVHEPDCSVRAERMF